MAQSVRQLSPGRTLLSPWTSAYESRSGYRLAIANLVANLVAVDGRWFAVPRANLNRRDGAAGSTAGGLNGQGSNRNFTLSFRRARSLWRR